MSRLDYVTVGIVAVCLAALGFLVFKTVGLMNGDGETQTPNEYANPDPIDTSRYDTSGFTDPAFSSEGIAGGDDNSYSEEDDKSRDMASDKKTTDKKAADTKTTTTAKGATEPAKKPETVTAEKSTTKSGTSPAAAATKKAKEPATTTKSTASKASDTEPVKAKSASTGRYAVQAGSFASRSNADVLVKKLKKLGYDNAQVMTSKDNGKAIVIVDRFSNSKDAEALVQALKNKEDKDLSGAFVKSSQ